MLAKQLALLIIDKTSIEQFAAAGLRHGSSNKDHCILLCSMAEGVCCLRRASVNILSISREAICSVWAVEHFGEHNKFCSISCSFLQGACTEPLHQPTDKCTRQDLDLQTCFRHTCTASTARDTFACLSEETPS